MLTKQKILILKTLLVFVLCFILAVISIVLTSPLWRKQSTYSRYSLANSYPSIPSSVKTLSVQNGEYLAKLGNCISCHTSQGGKQPFAGGRMIETPFGAIPSTNITPDKVTGIGKWSLKDFKRAMKQGIGPSGKHYFPAFPYPYFAKLRDNDLSDLFAYFRIIPAINKKNIALGFPFNLWGSRTSMYVWDSLFLPIKFPNKDNASRGQYLVNSISHCGACHTPLNWIGAPKQTHYLAGTFIDGFFAPNIAKAGLQKNTTGEISNTLSKGVLLFGAGPYAGPMAEVHENSLAFLSKKDLMLIAKYIKEVQSTPTYQVEIPKGKSSIKKGQSIYQQICIECHNTGLLGAPRLGNHARWSYRIENQGLNQLYHRSINGFNRMPKLGGCVNCKDEDILAAVNYMIYASVNSTKWRQVKPHLKW